MQSLRKALSARCPQCGQISVLIVRSYKTALRSVAQHSFECPNCETEFNAQNGSVGLEVVQVTSENPSSGRLLPTA